MFYERLAQEMKKSRRVGLPLALLFLDLDHFKLVNDTHGHSAGDELLKAVAQRMKICVRAVDTIARLGGDEFVVLVPDIDSLDDIRTVAIKLLETLIPPYEIEGQSAVSTPSIGISIYPDDGGDIDLLMKHADTAMYQAKQSGRGNFKFFENTAPPQEAPG